MTLENLFNTFFLPIYFAPTIVGFFRKTPKLGVLFWLNFLAGWTVIIWIFCWLLVFGGFQPLVHSLARLLGGGSGQPAAPASFGAEPGQQPPKCGYTGCVNGKIPCSQCQARGSWYEPPTTATGTATLRTCTACQASGKLTCPGCNGTGLAR